jgi:hypothetical protein
MLGFEPFLLSIESVISLSLKTMLNNVDSALFLLNSARLLSDETLALFSGWRGCERQFAGFLWVVISGAR